MHIVCSETLQKNGQFHLLLSRSVGSISMGFINKMREKLHIDEGFKLLYDILVSAFVWKHSLRMEKVIFKAPGL